MEKIGKYQILETVGKGAMGEVYKARDEMIDRIVAIKVIHHHFVEEELWESLQERFQQEAKAAARCFHTNIVAVFDFGIQDGTPYLVMEYIEGQDLKDVLKLQQRFSVEQAIDIMCPVLQALDYAHANGVVHRDIKPANIIKLNCGEIKVADFGIARIDSSELTAVGDMVGTPVYMSPESMRGDVVDGRADIYSSALVFIELITGEKPVSGFIDQQVLRETFDKHGIDENKYTNLLAILAHALHRQPEYRFQRASDFAAKLKEVIQPPYSPLPQASEDALDDDHDGTVILSAVQQRAAKQHINEEKDHHLLSKIEKTLASYIGPLSSVIVKRKSSTCASQEQLISELSLHIKDLDERKQFLAAVQQQTGTSIPAPASHSVQAELSQISIASASSLDETRVKQIKDSLSTYLGPMAPIIVKKLLKKTVNEQELIAKLVDKIPEEEEKEEFLASLQ